MSILPPSVLSVDKETELQNANTVLPAGTYKHYKNMLYKVYGVGMHTETEELLVFYQSLYGKFEFWARPYKMFCESVNINGVEVPRFQKID